MTMNMLNKDIRGDYATINGLKLYYEVQGTGEPLFLLHGGVGASEMFGASPAVFAENRQVIAVHLQGHGHTLDIDRPLSFEAMGDDIAALIKHLGFDKADILGYSLGGGASLQTAIRHPEVVRRLVLISTPFKQKGFYPEVLANMAQMGPDAARFMSQSPLAQLYPDKDWARLFTKLGELLRQDYDWSKGVTGIKAPVMLAYADADAVQPSHIMEFFSLLGGGQRDAGMDGSGRPITRLAILPGMTHYDVLFAPTLPTMIEAFLAADLPGSR